MEIGIGIHGEPGRPRMKLETAAEITEMSSPDPRRPCLRPPGPEWEGDAQEIEWLASLTMRFQKGDPGAPLCQRHGRDAPPN